MATFQWDSVGTAMLRGGAVEEGASGLYRRHLAGCLGGILPPLLRAGRPQDCRRDGGVTKFELPYTDGVVYP